MATMARSILVAALATMAGACHKAKQCDEGAAEVKAIFFAVWAGQMGYFAEHNKYAPSMLDIRGDVESTLTSQADKGERAYNLATAKYKYSTETTATGFVATARGDIDGDGYLDVWTIAYPRPGTGAGIGVKPSRMGPDCL